jgi:predicted RND superfamily exporter protein
MHASSGSHDPNSFAGRALSSYARQIIRRPLAILLTLVLLAGLATWATTKLSINSNQLDLIDQNLTEVKDVKRLIDMIGGAGFIILAVRSEDGPKLRGVADDLAARIMEDHPEDRVQPNKKNIRYVTYKVPIEFIQKNMPLFIKTEDLVEAKKRINVFIRDQAMRADPFFIDIEQKPPVKLEMQDIIDKYSHVGKKSIKEDYYVSDDGKMITLLLKPTWDNNDLGRTKTYLTKLNALIEKYKKDNPRGVTITESYEREVHGPGNITYGLTGGYKTSVDDSYAIQDSLEPVSIIAFLAISLITILFFRKLVPTLIVVSGMVIGTIYSMGVAYLVFRQLNMITSILGGILMGFGVDYGIQFIYRTRIELGMGKRYDRAIHDALVNAGRPAFIAAVVTSGSFLMLVTSKFKGFSEFGVLAGLGTMIIGFTLFCWSPALLSLLGRINPTWPAKLIGVTVPPKSMNEGGEIRIPKPRLLLGSAVAVTLILCACAIPWVPFKAVNENAPTLWERIRSGVRFNYNTRALLPEDQTSVKLQDEINDRFQISSDTVAVYTKDLDDAKAVFDELNAHMGEHDKYSTVEQVVSIWSFVPPPETAIPNAKVLEEWEHELSDINVDLLPENVKKQAAFFKEVLAVRPFGVDTVMKIYGDMFKSLPEAKPENQGYLTFIYPKIDLRDGKKMIEFSEQVKLIKTANGKEFRGAGQPLLFSNLAQTVLHDGKWSVVLTAIWILLMHFLDFRSVKLALASVIPLGVGLVMMLGMLSISNHQLNFMNIIILPILLGFGVSHGLYLLHRFLEGTSPVVALKSVGAAVASSTLTAIAGFGSLFWASHNGLKSMGFVACLGLTTTLIVSFTVLAAVLQLIHDQRTKAEAADAAKPRDDDGQAA